MDESFSFSFRNRKIPTYEDLFKVNHTGNQALCLFEEYICYRSLQDSLSLRTSHWEQLVQTLYHYVKDDTENESKWWLCLVNLAIRVREGITKPNEKTYSSVHKSFLLNKDLFQAQFHKKMTEELTLSIGCYLLLIEKNKSKASEICSTNQKLQELVSSFPDFTDEQNDFMAGNNPHFVLIKILDQLRSIVKKAHPPFLTEVFDEYQRAAEEQEESVAMEKSESSADKRTSDTAEASNTIENITSNEPDTNVEITNVEMNSPRRSTRSTLSKYKSKSSPLVETTSPAKLPSSSTTIALCESPDRPTHVENGSRIDGTHKKSTPTKAKPSTPAKTRKQHVSNDNNGDDIDSEFSPKKKSKLASLNDLNKDSDAEEQRPLSSASNSPAATPRRRRGLRDLKIVGDVPADWSSDEDYLLSPKLTSKEVPHRRRQSLELPKRFKLRTSRHPWTEAEEKKLLKGVETLGLGQWSAILKSFQFASYRDNVSLKDKWRNMVKNRAVPKKYL